MAWLAQVLLQSVERVEERVQVCLVRLLSRCEARLVHAVVDCVVNPVVHFVDLLAQMFWVEASTWL